MLKQRERERESVRERESLKGGAANSEGESPLCNSMPQSEGAPKPATP